jgi:hypothetical protein
MIKELFRYLFGAPIKKPYQRGRDYALGELKAYGPDVIDRLEAESLGSFNTTGGEKLFDQGVRDQIRDYRAQQKEIVRNMLK